MKKYLERFKNEGTIIGAVGLIGLIANQFGFKVDLVWLDTTIKLICGLGVLLGILNNSETKGLDNPFVRKPDITDIKPNGQVTDFRG